jgi:hypothetical protein
VAPQSQRFQNQLKGVSGEEKLNSERLFAVEMKFQSCTGVVVVVAAEEGQEADGSFRARQTAKIPLAEARS